MTDGAAKILDMEQIAAMARGRDSEQRMRLALNLNDSLGAQAQSGSDRERTMFNAILDQLLGTIERDLRIRLAEDLANREDVPRPLVALLANQDIEIARPVLRNSPVLNDADLIEVVRHRTLEHQLVVASRNDISEALSEELVGTGQTRVIVALLQNHGARVRAATLSYLAEQAERVDAFREPLVRREDLPEAVASRLYRLVSGALREGLAQRYDFDVGLIDDALNAVIRKAMDALKVSQAHPTMAQALADEIAQTKSFDSGLMIDALKRGEIALFEAMLIQQLGLRPGDVRRIIYDTSGELFAVSCRAIGMSPDDFAMAYDLTRRAFRQNKEVAEDLRRRAMILFNRLQNDAAAALVRQWRRDPSMIRHADDFSEGTQDAVA